MTRRKCALAARTCRRATARDLAVGDAVLQIELLDAVDEVLIRQTIESRSSDHIAMF